VTATATADAPLPVPEPKEDSPRRQTQTQRQQHERTNQYGLDQYRTEGNVIGVERTATGLVITLALGRGETLEVVFTCQSGCPDVSAGQYVTATGESGDDGRFQADEVTVER
jgi:hypothetical protein